MRVASFVLAFVIAASAANAQSHGGGPAGPVAAPENCVPPAVIEAMRARFPAPPSPSSPQLTLFADPMAGGMNSFGRTITNYVDRGSGASLLDWNCGAVTYDGHQGVDIEIRDFVDMDEGVAIVCAAPGTVVAAHDGEYDRRTQWESGVVANYAIVQHADGSLAYYWHMRNGSVRVASGQTVSVGDTLGMVGSSGFSSGPHLHFEVNSAGVRDPFSGDCQPNPGWWSAQGPYVWTHPVEIFNSGVTTMGLDWPTVCERPPGKTHVVAGSTTFGWIRVRNLATTDLVTYRYFSPQGLWSTYSFNPSGSYSSSWWYVFWTLPVSPSLYGEWRLEIQINGVLRATHVFDYDDQPNQLADIATRTVPTPANTPVVVDLAGTDPDGSVHAHRLLSGPDPGEAALAGVRAHQLRYTPAPGFTGLDSVIVDAVDDEGADGPDAVIRFAVGEPLAAPSPSAAVLRLSCAPNPVRASSRLSFTLPRESDVTMDLLDVHGRRVASWAPGRLGAGEHGVHWRELAGSHAGAPGLWFVRLRAGGESVVERVTRLD